MKTFPGASALVCGILACLLVSVDSPGAGAVASDDGEDRLADIITALRVEEAKYRNLEYLIRTTTRKVEPGTGEGGGQVMTEETREVVLQDGRIFFRSVLDDRSASSGSHFEQTSAFDGEKTRTVVPDNCVNFHEGRFEHPETVPAHSVPLIHYQLNFPLSVYLSGTDAIQADPRSPRGAQGGSPLAFSKVVARFEKEEEIDGLRCVKIRCDRWYSRDGTSAKQYLWLAPERNYHCIKEVFSSPKPDDPPSHEMHVERFREIAPRIWFPVRIVVDEAKRDSIIPRRRKVATHATTIAARVSLAPEHELSFFRDVPIPANLPTFTIKARALIGSRLPEPVPGETGERRLREALATLRENEARYANLEVKARSQEKYVISYDQRMGPFITDNRHERSVSRGTRGYLSTREDFVGQSGTRSSYDEIETFDGRWGRRLIRSGVVGGNELYHASIWNRGDRNPERRGDAIPLLRPHGLLVRPLFIYLPLSDFLTLSSFDKDFDQSLKTYYCGEGEIDGHPCVALRAEIRRAPRSPALFGGFAMVFWLATDRNYVPIRFETYSSDREQHIPSVIGHCTDFREIASGLWYPFRSELLQAHPISETQGWLLLRSRFELDVESATLGLAKDAPAYDINVPARTSVRLLDSEGKAIREFTQEQAGPIVIPEAPPGMNGPKAG
jgi:hypothetical protein